MGFEIGERLARIARDRRGVAAIEFACVAPFLVLLLLGIISYGGYFWMAHTVQETANDAARAALGGLDPVERDQFARASYDANIAGLGAGAATASTLTVQESGGRLSVVVAYNAENSPFFALRSLVPLPNAKIQRSASIQRGGY